MYSKQEIETACSKCGINSVATSLLISYLSGDTKCAESLIPPGGAIERDGRTYLQIDSSPYYVSKEGDIYSSKRRKIVKPVLHGKYFVFTMSSGVFKREGKSRKHRIHIAVATKYVPNPENKPFVNHIDLNPLNNHFSNLEWVTQIENTVHYNTELLKREDRVNHSSKLTQGQMETISLLFGYGVSQTELCRIYGVNEPVIRKVTQG